MKISFCSSVKNRLQHLRQTLPHNIGIVHGDELRMIHQNQHNQETLKANIKCAQSNYKKSIFVANIGKQWGV